VPWQPFGALVPSSDRILIEAAPTSALNRVAASYGPQVGQGSDDGASADIQVVGEVIEVGHGSGRSSGDPSGHRERRKGWGGGGAGLATHLAAPPTREKVLEEASFCCLGENGFGLVAPVAFAVVGSALPAGSS
jgi:hypothetical protein